MSGEPYPKSEQLQHGRQRRYRRKVASAKTWARITDAKIGPCRVCLDPASNGRLYGRIEFHHVVPRDAPWFGDDLEDNIVPLCRTCHEAVTKRSPRDCADLCAALTDAEYAYMIERVGEGAAERIYGIEYDRG